MFMHIVTQIVGQITAQFTRLCLWIKGLLSNSVKRLRVLIIQAYQNVVNLLHLLLQRVRTVLLQSSVKLVELIKLAQSRLKGSKIALTRMVAPSTQDGLKSQGRAKQRQQPVNKASKKGK